MNDGPYFTRMEGAFQSVTPYMCYNKSMESPLYTDVIAWCRENGRVRAAVLTSSRARKDNSVDALSDYDLELFVDDLAPFLKDDEWLEAFGPVLVRWPLKAETTFSEEWVTRLVQYEEGTRIDFQITARPLHYHDSFDAGYEVIVDKDGPGADLPPARSENLLIPRPAEEEFRDRVNAFFWDILYVPKALKREELFFARYMLDNIIRYEILLPMLEWHAAMNHGWNIGTNKRGRWIKPYLPEDVWKQCEATFSGAGIGESGRACRAMVRLFGRLAREVGAGLGYAYPEEQEKKVLDYMGSLEGISMKHSD